MCKPDVCTRLHIPLPLVEKLTGDADESGAELNAELDAIVGCYGRKENLAEKISEKSMPPCNVRMTNVMLRSVTLTIRYRRMQIDIGGPPTVKSCAPLSCLTFSSSLHCESLKR